MISSGRLKEIGKFIRSGGFSPTNLLINFVDKPSFDFISDEQNSDPNLKFGWITLPTKYRSAWIIDGQHRLYGYSHLDGTLLDQSLFIVAFEKMDTIKEADLFITINSKQKSVPKSLLVSLLADIRMGDSDPRTGLAAIASAVVRALNHDKSSAFFRRFATHGVAPEPNQNLTISEAVNGLVRSGLIGKVLHGNVAPGPLSAGEDDATVERARKVFNGYFEELWLANPDRWEAGKSAYVSVNPGVRAHMALIAEIVTYLSHKRNIDFAEIAEDQFVREICSIAAPAFSSFKTSSDAEVKRHFERKFGEGGVKLYLYELCEIVQQKFANFGSEEFRAYIEQKGSTVAEEADRFVLKFSSKLQNHVFTVLRGVYGT